MKNSLAEGDQNPASNSFSNIDKASFTRHIQEGTRTQEISWRKKDNTMS